MSNGMRSRCLRIELFFCVGVYNRCCLLLLFVCWVVRGARQISLLGETARAVCGNYKSPELGLNLSGS